MPLSILDLAPISAGGDAATALRNTIDLAQHAERWGYQPVLDRRASLRRRRQLGAGRADRADRRRYQHDSRRRRPPSSSSHTTAAAVVESFGMLDAFYPGRIDLGVGRSGQRRREAAISRSPAAKNPPPRQWRDVDGVVIPPPFDMRALMRNEPGARHACRSCSSPRPSHPTSPSRSATSWRCWTAATRSTGSTCTRCPVKAPRLTPWIFGSSKGQSAQVAGARGLPFVASYHITPATALEAIDVYRDAFVPSAALSRAVRGGLGRRRGGRRHRHRADTWRPATATGCTPSARAAVPFPTRTPTSRDPLTDEQLRGREGPRWQRNSSATPTRSPTGWRRCSASPAPTSWSSPPSPTGTPTGCARTS